MSDSRYGADRLLHRLGHRVLRVRGERCDLRADPLDHPAEKALAPVRVEVVRDALYRVLLASRLFEPTVDIRRLLAQGADQPHDRGHQQEDDQQNHQGRRRPVSSPELPPEPFVQREGDHRENHPDADGGQERLGELVHEVREEGKQGAGDERADHSTIHGQRAFPVPYRSHPLSGSAHSICF